MKNVILAGGVAGLIAGILAGAINYFGLLFGLGGIKIPLINAVVATVLLTIFFGAIFGLLYRALYESIPGEGVKKGFLFGLIIWLIKDITAGAFLLFVSSMNIYYASAATNLVVVGSYQWMMYGLSLGFLYRK
jgi:hypothetical protein